MLILLYDLEDRCDIINTSKTTAHFCRSEASKTVGYLSAFSSVKSSFPRLNFDMKLEGKGG